MTIAITLAESGDRCLVLLEMREWPVPAPFAQVTHAIKHMRLIAVTFALEDV